MNFCWTAVNDGMRGSKTWDLIPHSGQAKRPDSQ
jgi:hypothetical protein